MTQYRSAPAWLVLVAIVLGGGPALAAIEQQHISDDAAPTPEPPAPVLTRPPELTVFVNAAYPPDLLYRGIGGEVLLHIDIDARGQVSRVEVVEASVRELGVPAMVAASQFVFTPAEIDYAPAPIRIEYRYVFTPSLPEPDAIAGAPDQDGPGDGAPVNFEGLVREAGNRIPIAGAVVYVSGRPVAETDDEGHFEVRGVPPGSFMVEIRSPYHQKYRGEERLTDDELLRANYYLPRTSRDPYETTVVGKAERREVSKVQLTRTEVTKVPGTSGDPIRVIENLPGSARPPAGIGALLIRGSNPSDSAVFIDGVQIPILYHFGGLTSVVNAQFLDQINHYPGGFGARFGRAIAGVVDVKSRDLDCDTWRGTAEWSFLEGHLYTCLEINDWMVGGAVRRSFVDLLLPFILTEVVPRRKDEGVLTATPAYLDYQVKLQGRDGRHTFEVFAFGADDRLEIIQTLSEEDLNFDFGLVITWHRLMFRHRYQLGPDTTITTQVTPGYTRTGFEGGTEDLDLEAGSGLELWTADVREEVTHAFNDSITLNAGIDLQLGEGRFSLDLPLPTVINAFPDAVFDITAVQSLRRTFPVYNHSYWAELVWETDFGLKLIPGVRFDGFVFGDVDHAALQPRITGRWEFLEGMTVKAAYGWYEKMPEPQYLLDGFGNPNLVPLRSHQFIVGYEHVFTEQLNVDVQAYYNIRERIPSPTDAVTFGGGRAIDENYTSLGTGASYGLELLLRYLPVQDGLFYGWIAYTLSRSVRRDTAQDATLASQGPGLADELDLLGPEYPSNFDQTHILTVVAQFNLPWGLEAGLRFRLVSGNPITPIERGNVYVDMDQDEYNVDLSGVERNSDRLPVFHQLDVRIDKTWTFDLWKLTAYLEILNAYNANNVEQYRYDYRFVERVGLSGLTFVPVIGVKGEF